MEYTKNDTTESGTSLHFINFYNYFQSHASDLMSLPIFLTEGGVDCNTCASKAVSGWAARGTAQKYQDWLTWFDGKMAGAPYVKGVTLFEIGNPTSWPSFDLEPISSWLTNYLVSH